MKCPSCGEENVQGARFCNFCGTKLPVLTEETSADSAHAPDKPSDERRHMPTIGEEGHTASRHAPADKGVVFLFEDERQEADKRKRTFEDERATARLRLEQQKRNDPFYGEDEDEDDDYDDDDYDEDDVGAGRKAVMIIISVVTVLALVFIGYWFAFRTDAGRRLRASSNIAASAEDYMTLGDWQKANANYANAADSYYRAFRQNRDDFDFALRVARCFEECNALDRAESVYVYLITNAPTRDEPYDRLLALLNREGKTEQYQRLLELRQTNQSDPQNAS